MKTEKKEKETKNTEMYVSKELLKKMNKDVKDAKRLIIFKIGDQSKGWIPEEKHIRKFAEMLEVLRDNGIFDDKTAIVPFHYGITAETISL